jgi:hypothetical protein
MANSTPSRVQDWPKLSFPETECNLFFSIAIVLKVRTLFSSVLLEFLNGRSHIFPKILSFLKFVEKIFIFLNFFSIFFIFIKLFEKLFSILLKLRQALRVTSEVDFESTPTIRKYIFQRRSCKLLVVVIQHLPRKFD